MSASQRIQREMKWIERRFLFGDLNKISRIKFKKEIYENLAGISKILIIGSNSLKNYMKKLRNLSFCLVNWKFDFKTELIMV